MGIPSKAVHSGRNPDLGSWRDDRYVRCSRCGFILNLDRHARAPYGSKAGDGVTHPSPLTYDESGEEYDATGTTYNGGQNDFTVNSGCPFCGSLTYDQEEAI